MALALEKKEAIKSKVKDFIKVVKVEEQEKAEIILLDILDNISDDLITLQSTKVSSADIAVLIQEMRNDFALMEKRFEAVDRRFEAVDRRFEALQKEMNFRFESLQKEMNIRFEAVDKRFEDLIHYMDKRFESVDKRFESVDKRFAMLQWLMGIGFTMMAVLMSVYKFL